MAPGDVLVQHIHKYSHLSILAKGSVVVTVDGVQTTHRAPTCIVIVAGKHHGVKALEDSVWYCVHAIPSELPDGGMNDEVFIVQSPTGVRDMRAIAESLV